MRRPAFGNGPPAEEEGWLEADVERLRRQRVNVRAELRQGHNLAGVLREAIADLSPDLLLLAWRPEPATRRGPLQPDRLELRDLLLDVPCDLGVLAHEGVPGTPKRVLLSVADNADIALARDLGYRLATGAGGTLTLIDVAAPGSEEPANAAERFAPHLEALPDRTHVTTRLAHADTPASAVLQQADPGEFDLLVIGAPTGGVVHRLALGALPERIVSRSELPVLIVKRRPTGASSTLRRLWDTVTDRVPRLSEAEKVEVYRDVRRGARPTTDFYVMIALAAAIAALGLLLNSAAVVIGGMLVAPLMAPVIAIGLGVVHGDARLLRLAAVGVIRGSLLAVLVGIVLAVAVPGADLTNEVLARSRPSLLDLTVALAAGAAGAYAIGREQVSASLPGVAIAVALVPPLAVVGIGLAAGEWTAAGGASLLFLANLAGIAGTAGFLFLLFGFAPEPEHASRLRVFGRGFTALALLIVIVAIPIGWLTIESFSRSSLERSVAEALDRELDGVEDLRWISFDLNDGDGPLDLTVQVEALRAVLPTEAAALQNGLALRLDRDVRLGLRVVQVAEIAPGESAPAPAAEPPPDATRAATEP